MGGGLQAEPEPGAEETTTEKNSEILRVGLNLDRGRGGVAHGRNTTGAKLKENGS